MQETSFPRFERYVAIGDSSTEGLIDPDGQGGFRGWSQRLAEHIAHDQGHLLYANLAIRGRRTRQVLDEQLEPALAMKPDLATVFVGTNDAVSRSFDVERVAADIGRMQRDLAEGGATVLTFTMPDLSEVMPMARRIAPRLEELNDALRTVADEAGSILVDFARIPMAGDRRLWHEDRLHAKSQGHERIAAALAAALEVPGFSESWQKPLPPLPPWSLPRRAWEELRWGGKYFLPWCWRHLRGRSSGDGVSAKRPTLTPVEPPLSAADPVS